ncbi:hypothetical protein HPB51_016807 [Rhipicephalus microplus]|uniref:THAP-type domain-containing protein n=1 Tax=Rhipicephalus microplus TaxID=6941 RepID=A0A9J6DI11_RHIMP|nr:hypothetical protein HPB51_016807 [Rhipicephalus microplus]
MKSDCRLRHRFDQQHILPGTTVYSNEWAAYQCIPRLVDANGTPLNLDWHTVNHSVNFVDPTTGANMQRIESEWQKAKRRLVRNSIKTTTSLMPCHLAWLWWRSMNARPNVKDAFLRLMEVCEKHFHTSDFVTTSTYQDEKTGRVLEVPLQMRRLKPGAIPSLFPNCPSYLSRPTTVVREGPEEKRLRLEGESLQKAIRQSAEAYKEEKKKNNISSF